MGELTALVATVGVPAIVVLLILDKVKGLMNSKSTKNNHNPTCVHHGGLLDVLKASVEQQGRANENITQRQDAQTRLMQKMTLTQKEISMTQKSIGNCLERVERKLSILARDRLMRWFLLILNASSKR